MKIFYSFEILPVLLWVFLRLSFQKIADVHATYSDTDEHLHDHIESAMTSEHINYKNDDIKTRENLLLDVNAKIKNPLKSARQLALLAKMTKAHA